MTMPAGVALRLAALGVDLGVLERRAPEFVELFDRLEMNGITRCALMQLVTQATIYSEEEVDGPGFAEKVARVNELLKEGDDEVRENLAREDRENAS